MQYVDCLVHTYSTTRPTNFLVLPGTHICLITTCRANSIEPNLSLHVLYQLHRKPNSRPCHFRFCASTVRQLNTLFPVKSFVRMKKKNPLKCCLPVTQCNVSAAPLKRIGSALPYPRCLDQCPETGAASHGNNAYNIASSKSC